MHVISPSSAAAPAPNVLPTLGFGQLCSAALYSIGLLLTALDMYCVVYCYDSKLWKGERCDNECASVGVDGLVEMASCYAAAETRLEFGGRTRLGARRKVFCRASPSTGHISNLLTSQHLPLHENTLRRIPLPGFGCEGGRFAWQYQAFDVRTRATMTYE